jgi:ribosome-binding factor A
MSKRSERVETQLKKDISTILLEELKDPRIGFITVIRVEVTADLRYAKIYFSILGDDEAKEKALKGINSAKGYIRKLVGDRMKMRYVPELEFKLDSSIEYSISLENVFDKIHNEHKNSENTNKEG